MRWLLYLTVIPLLALASGCATPSTDRAEESGSTQTCYVCRYNNDLACVKVRVNDSTPRTEYHGHTYCFCSEDCREAFSKNPDKYWSREVSINESGPDPFIHHLFSSADLRSASV
jgi:YHS domain-containing protein